MLHNCRSMSPKQRLHPNAWKQRTYGVPLWYNDKKVSPPPYTPMPTGFHPGVSGGISHTLSAIAADFLHVTRNTDRRNALKIQPIAVLLDDTVKGRSGANQGDDQHHLRHSSPSCLSPIRQNTRLRNRKSRRRRGRTIAKK